MRSACTTTATAAVGFSLLVPVCSLAQNGAPSTTTPSITTAATDMVARRLFLAGREAFVRGDYATAERMWERAFALSGRSVLLLNVATARERLGRFEEAARALRDYLWLEPRNRRRETIERRIEALRRRVALRQGVDPRGWPMWTAAGGAALLGIGAALLYASAQQRYAELASGCGARRAGCAEEAIASVASRVTWSRVLLGLSVASAGTAAALWWFGGQRADALDLETEEAP